jgi:hypothetical protein
MIYLLYPWMVTSGLSFLRYVRLAGGYFIAVSLGPVLPNLREATLETAIQQGKDYESLMTIADLAG